MPSVYSVPGRGSVQYTPMYIPAAFRETRLDALHGLIQANSFGTLVSQLDGELFATHIPFLLSPALGPNGTLRGHMARANPHWRAFDGAEALAIFQGPHAYISPAWYVAEEAVPTWNYAVVHVYGAPRVVDDPREVRDILEETVNTFDTEGWRTARVDEQYITNLAKAIVAFEMPIARLQGKRKLGQNRPVEDARGAARGLRAVADQMEATAQLRA
jgi:transcriptional regulator